MRLLPAGTPVTFAPRFGPLWLRYYLSNSYPRRGIESSPISRDYRADAVLFRILGNDH
jgi:hypothetical protein